MAAAAAAAGRGESLTRQPPRPAELTGRPGRENSSISSASEQLDRHVCMLGRAVPCRRPHLSLFPFPTRSLAFCCDEMMFGLVGFFKTRASKSPCLLIPISSFSLPSQHKARFLLVRGKGPPYSSYYCLAALARICIYLHASYLQRILF